MTLLQTYLVEDSPVIRENLIATLEELAPVQVVGSADGEQDALTWLAAHPSDLVIVDLFLAQGSGLGVLRGRRPGTRCVVLSNYVNPAMRARCLALGAERVFDKSTEIDALLHHLRCTGDTSLLDENVPFLDSPPVPEGAEDLYGTPTVSGQQGSVYEHAARALDLSLRVGAHGLPLMCTGDWNDGMNRVGAAGRGESVWLAWFLCPLVAGMAPLARERGDRARADRWEAAATGWRAALESQAWDGAWYRRAFFDNGQPLGSAANAEARIDLIAQAWAVLSGAAPLAHQQQAMASAREHLADGDAGLLRLLTPPLAQAEPSAGYIQAYPPGVRENGGQYTHGGVWALMAQARLEAEGHAPASDLPYRWFTWLSPAHRAADAQHGKAYGLEPYAVAGDVYSAPPYVGRGGWSWYTGAASWLHRAAVESVFGLTMDATTLSLRPALPAHWPRAEMTLRRGDRLLQFVVLQGAGEAAEPLDAVPLHPGESVAWTTLPLHTRFVMRLRGPTSAGHVTGDSALRAASSQSRPG